MKPSPLNFDDDGALVEYTYRPWEELKRGNGANRT